MKHLANVLRFGWPYFGRYWPRLVAGVTLGILFGLSNASFVWATKTLISRMSPAEAREPAAAPDSQQKFLTRLVNRAEAVSEAWVDEWLPESGTRLTTRQVIGGLLFFPLLVGMRGFIGYGSSYCMAWVSERVVNDLRVDVLKKLSGLSLDFYNRSTMGDLLTRVTTDTASLQRCLNLGFSDLIKEPTTILGILIGLLLIDPQLTLGAMIFFPLCVVPIIVLGKKVRKASKAGLNVNITQSSLLVEMLSGIRVVKAYSLEEAQEQRFRKMSRDLIHFAMKGVRAKEMINPIIETVSMVGFGLLIVYIASKGLTFGEMGAFLAGVAFFYTPVKKLAGLHVLFEQTSAGVNRLMQILREEPSVKEPLQPKPLKDFKTGLRFENVNFAYGSELVVQNLSLDIPRGLKLGIAGESGSGKSTLVNLLFRFYDPTGGAIKIDGLDLREVSSLDLRRLMALVSQEVVIFDQSVAENIACGLPNASREEIEQAAKAAYAHEFIRQLPQGYDTRVGERGVTLSGGQRQRIAIARAFIRNAPILVLDEATASLDSQAEAEVQADIDRLSEHRTVICVAHRLSTLARMDRVIVMRQGRMIESGSFEELLRLDGAFARMARKQGITAGAAAN